MQKAAKLIFNPDENYWLSSRMWQGVPGIERTGKRLWTTWFSGGKYEPCIHNYGILAYSDDDGESWVEPYLIIAADVKNGMRVMDAQLWTEPSGRLWCYWAQDVYPEDAVVSDYDTDGNKLFDVFFGDVQAWGIYTDNPEDDNPTWSEPIHIGSGFIRNKPTVLSTGDIFIPGYAVKNKIYYQYMMAKTFGEDTNVCEGPLQIGDKGFDECMAVEQNDGSVRFLVRTNTGHLAEAFSYDGCKTWTKTSESDIPNPCTRFFIRRLKNGMLLLINTPSSKVGNRKSLVAFLSRDDGKTWEYSLVLDERHGTTYPDAVESDDGYIYMIYDCQRDNRQKVCKENPMKSEAVKEICLAKFTVDDVINGAISTSGSFLAKVISKCTYDSRALGTIEGKN